MASKFSLCFFCVLVLSTLFGLSVAKEKQGFQFQNIVNTLSNSGYNAMSLTLDLTLPTLISSSSTNPNATTTTFTIFCPTDESFFSLKYTRQPSLTLLRCHIAPMKLDKEALQSSSSLTIGSKIDTLLHGHPLVVTSPHGKNVSINNLKIRDWEIYNDGVVIVHEVDNFFDPAYQTIFYPWYDEGVTVNNKNFSSSSGFIESISEIIREQIEPTM